MKVLNFSFRDSVPSAFRFRVAFFGLALFLSGCAAPAADSPEVIGYAYREFTEHSSDTIDRWRGWRVGNDKQVRRITEWIARNAASHLDREVRGARYPARHVLIIFRAHRAGEWYWLYDDEFPTQLRVRLKGVIEECADAWEDFTFQSDIPSFMRPWFP
ncbi:MAG: hypothetical protein AMXMBFR47_08860 [Planctomycetota bacterium]